jgi:hypothetical protein
MAIRFLVESHIVVDNFSCSLHVYKNLTFYNFIRNLRFEFSTDNFLSPSAVFYWLASHQIDYIL